MIVYLTLGCMLNFIGPFFGRYLTKDWKFWNTMERILEYSELAEHHMSEVTLDYSLQCSS